MGFAGSPRFSNGGFNIFTFQASRNEGTSPSVVARMSAGTRCQFQAVDRATCSNERLSPMRSGMANLKTVKKIDDPGTQGRLTSLV